MSRANDEYATLRYERGLKHAGKETYVLRLYVTGASAASTRAIANLKKICQERLHGRYQLEVIDIFQQPELASGEQIGAAPTLVKALPLPLRRFIGDLSRAESILVGLGLKPTTPSDPA
jgi:circadian clock protein KaiB